MFIFTAPDGVEIHVHEWPVDEPVGIVQIAHGMGEHALRYAPLAAALNAAGYTVYGADHRGHGESMHGEPGHLGEDGWNRLVADMVTLSELARKRHPGLPLVLVGHSLGSFAAQQYALEHADLLDGLALSGTTAVDLLPTALPADAEGNVLEAFNKPFEPARTAFDWLSRDDIQVDAYLADPWCGFSLDDQALLDLFTAAPRLAAPVLPADLPVYVFVGSADPLNAGLALSDVLVERYRAAGVADLTYRVYPEARHEVLNESNRTEVIMELTDWIRRVAR